MGSEIEGQCNQCGREFTYSDGGGFYFDLLRCELCGQTLTVDTDPDQPRRAEPPADLCQCGGRFSHQAKVRCPFCKSTDISKGAIIMDYD